MFELTGANLDGQLVTTLTIQFTAWLKLHYNGNWRENSKVNNQPNDRCCPFNGRAQVSTNHVLKKDA